PRLLAVLPAQHMVVGDVVRALAVVRVDLDPVTMHQDGEAHALQGRVPEAVDVRAKIERVVWEGRRASLERLLQLGHERFELRLPLVRSTEDQAAAQRKGLDLLQADDVRSRFERGQRVRYGALAPSGAGEAAKRMSEVTDVVAQDAQGHGRECMFLFHARHPEGGASRRPTDAGVRPRAGKVREATTRGGGNRG